MTAEHPLLSSLVGGAALLTALTVAAVGGLLARDPDLFAGVVVPEIPRIEAATVLDTRRATGPDGLTQGRFLPAGEATTALTFEAAQVSWGATASFRTSPVRILTGADAWNGQGGRLSALLDLPRDAQVELRRITGREAPADEGDNRPGRGRSDGLDRRPVDLDPAG